MTEPVRISAAEVRKKVNSGSALLVCAYDDEEKFRKVRLEGAISLSDFKAKLPDLSKDNEVFFYCA